MADREGIPSEDFWEKNDGERMDGLLRLEQYIRSKGLDAAHIWGAWYDIKQIVKAALYFSDAIREKKVMSPTHTTLQDTSACMGTPSKNFINKDKNTPIRFVVFSAEELVDILQNSESRLHRRVD